MSTQAGRTQKLTFPLTTKWEVKVAFEAICNDIIKEFPDRVKKAICTKKKAITAEDLLIIMDHYGLRATLTVEYDPAHTEQQHSINGMKKKWARKRLPIDIPETEPPVDIFDIDRG